MLRVEKKFGRLNLSGNQTWLGTCPETAQWSQLDVAAAAYPKERRRKANGWELRNVLLLYPEMVLVHVG